MKPFRAFVNKEFCHIFRDKRTMLILLAMPVIQILLFGFALSNEVKDAQIAVFDPSKDVFTRAVKDRFQASEYFTLTEELENVHMINDVFKYGKTNLVLVFSDHFADNLFSVGHAEIQLIADGSDPNYASMLTNYAAGIIGGYQQELMEKYGSPCRIVPQIKMLYNPQGKSAYFFVPGVMGLILMLICAMMTSIAIVREKETGSMEILLASPVKPLHIIMAKTVPYFTLSILNLITILLLSVFVLKVPVAGSLFWLFVVSLIFILTALALGLLISTLVNTQLAAMLSSGMVLMLPTILLSGMIFNIESMPAILQWFSTLIPARWYIIAVKKLMIQGVAVQYVLKETAILCAMAALLLGVSLGKFKTRLK